MKVNYYSYTTANSESKDFFSVIADHEFDVSLHKVNRYLIRKPTEANGHSLMFSLQNNSSLQKRHSDHHFCVQMLEFQHFRRSGEVKCSLCETFLGQSDVLCGRDIILYYLSLCAQGIIDYLFWNIP